MADQPYTAIAAQYASEDEAVTDFDALHEFYKGLGKHTAFDAAVVVRDLEGKVSIPKRDDKAKHHGGRKGLAIGLASGVVVALFPAVALGGALLAGGGAGAGIGALAGHISNNSSAESLKKISETLHAGSAGIVVVVDPAEADEVEKLLTHASSVTRKEIAVDDEKLDEEVQDAYE
ncbi:DUF1269 domain-containing protein [Planctomonas sp. JC2975]|uniref:DUF1269 domain-containing protein n=1 Tax=Planctomonas sp. JC2975 TaxID=2729626 RepID=UPI00147313FE|nr:DUF1269 domain-containing protein [Planctomonas sp. JC2975]NNC11601.1 DUF1269 domain-containing protein [Planctomonas sp. JC2975]